MSDEEIGDFLLVLLLVSVSAGCGSQNAISEANVSEQANIQVLSDELENTIEFSEFKVDETIVGEPPEGILESG
ncbi:MAG: hypothetical protein MJ157_02720 [Clostridia bacterium]|nr:hypothetical protein [Clostridia bacterium]